MMGDAAVVRNRRVVSLSAGVGAVWVVCDDGTIWHTNVRDSGPYWIQAPPVGPEAQKGKK